MPAIPFVPEVCIVSRLTIHTESTAPAEAQPRVQNVLRSSGFIPNLIGVLAGAPAALETYQEVGAINRRTSLSAAEREVVQITAAASNGCGFCVAGHTAISRKGKLLPEDVLSALRQAGVPEGNPKLKQLARFTLGVLQHKGNVPDGVLTDFYAAGYTAQQALEVVLGVSLATLCNYTNNLAHTPINRELQAYA